ncbi:MAG: lipopolysaccharide kinase InaA family protein [Planctomycetota bacterium]|jgi:hypothetical protein
MRESWWVAPESCAQLDALGLVSVAASMEIAAGGEVLSTDRQSAAVRLDGPCPLLVKWRRPREGRRARTLMRPSRERAEARAMIEAARRGLRWPAPLAVGERRRRGVLLGAVLVRPFLGGRETAAQVLRRSGDRWEEEAPVLALRAWHDAGFRHGDCYPKNVLLGHGEDPPVPIGAPKARFARAGPRLDRMRFRDLAQWAAGRVELRPDEAPFAFLDAYGRAPGLPSAETLEARIRPFYLRILDRKARRRASQAAREPGGPPAPMPLPPDPVPVRRRFRHLGDL